MTDFIETEIKAAQERGRLEGFRSGVWAGLLGAVFVAVIVVLGLLLTRPASACDSAMCSDSSSATPAPQTRMEIGDAISYTPWDETGIDFTYDDTDPPKPREVVDPDNLLEPDGVNIPWDFNRDGVVSDEEWETFKAMAGL